MGKLFLLIPALIFAGCAAKTGINDFPKTSNEVNFGKIEKTCAGRTTASWNPTAKFEYAFSTADTVLDEIHRGLLVALRHEGYSVVIDDPVGNAVIGVRGAWVNDVRSIAGAYFKKIDNACHIYVKIEVTQDFPGTWHSNRAQEICMSICKQLQAGR